MIKAMVSPISGVLVNISCTRSWRVMGVRRMWWCEQRGQRNHPPIRAQRKNSQLRREDWGDWVGWAKKGDSGFCPLATEGFALCTLCTSSSFSSMMSWWDAEEEGRWLHLRDGQIWIWQRGSLVIRDPGGTGIPGYYLPGFKLKLKLNILDASGTWISSEGKKYRKGDAEAGRKTSRDVVSILVHPY